MARNIYKSNIKMTKYTNLIPRKISWCSSRWEEERRLQRWLGYHSGVGCYWFRPQRSSQIIICAYNWYLRRRKRLRWAQLGGYSLWAALWNGLWVDHSQTQRNGGQTWIGFVFPTWKSGTPKGFLNLEFSEYHHNTLENTPHLNGIGCGQNEHTLKYYVK